jgi:hypothetical protein
MFKISSLCLGALFILIACSDGDGLVGADGGGEQGADATSAWNLEPGNTGHTEVGEALAAGKVRAGKVVSQGQLLSGLKAEGRIGDFKLYNDQVAFIIEGLRPSNGYVQLGGELADAAYLKAGSATGASWLSETGLGLGTNVVKPQSVGVLSDGSDGEAIVRVIGDLQAFEVISSLIPSTDPYPLKVAVDYVLKADVNWLELRVRAYNDTEHTIEVPMLLVVFFGGDGVEFFLDGTGFDNDKLTASQRNRIGIIGREISYGWTISDAKFAPLFSYNGLWFNSVEGFSIEPGAEAQRVLRLTVSPGNVANMQKSARRSLGLAELPETSGTVRDEAGEPLANARLHVVDSADGKTYVTNAVTDAGGNYRMGLAAGDYLFSIIADGREMLVTQPVTVGDSGASKDFSLAGTSTVKFSIVDQDGTDIPGKLLFHRTPKLAARPRSFGEQRYGGGAAAVVFHPGGEGQLALAPGTYAVTACRGLEYEIQVVDVTLEAQDEKTLSFTLKHSVDTTGYLSGDFHIHAMWSVDSSDLYETKVAAAAAEGLEIPVVTEHEYIGDYTPTIAKMGLQKWLQSIVGEELTTFSYGHFNTFPITADTSKPNNGALPWDGKDPAELFADVRSTWPDALLQVNHPRSTSVGGFFSTAGYNAETGDISSPTYWSTNYDAIEVFNGDGWSARRNSTMNDWFSLLDRGLMVTATGNSDSHKAYFSEVGYPRNYVKTSTDLPSNMEVSEFVSSIKGQRVTIGGGAFVEAWVGDQGVGSLVDATSKTVQLKIRVQAAEWVNIDTLIVIKGGKFGGNEVHEIKLDASTADAENPVIRYQDTLSLTLEQDNWVVVAAKGEGNLSPVVDAKEPFGITNPIFFDVDGNGKFDAPSSF